MTRFGRAFVTLALLLGLAVPATRVAAQEHAPEHGTPSNQIDITHHLANSHELEIPAIG